MLIGTLLTVGASSTVEAANRSPSDGDRGKTPNGGFLAADYVNYRDQEGNTVTPLDIEKLIRDIERIAGGSPDGILTVNTLEEADDVANYLLSQSQVGLGILEVPFGSDAPRVYNYSVYQTEDGLFIPHWYVYPENSPNAEGLESGEQEIRSGALIVPWVKDGTPSPLVFQPMEDRELGLAVIDRDGVARNISPYFRGEMEIPSDILANISADGQVAVVEMEVEETKGRNGKSSVKVKEITGVSENVTMVRDGSIVEGKTREFTLFEEATFSKKGRVNKNVINVRSGPGTNFPVIGTLEFGTEVLYKDVKESTWKQIQFEDTEEAYVSGPLLDFIEEQPGIEAEPLPAAPIVVGTPEGNSITADSSQQPSEFSTVRYDSLGIEVTRSAPMENNLTATPEQLKEELPPIVTHKTNYFEFGGGTEVYTTPMELVEAQPYAVTITNADGQVSQSTQVELKFRFRNANGYVYLVANANAFLSGEDGSVIQTENIPTTLKVGTNYDLNFTIIPPNSTDFARKLRQACDNGIREWNICAFFFGELGMQKMTFDQFVSLLHSVPAGETLDLRGYGVMLWGMGRATVQ